MKKSIISLSVVCLLLTNFQSRAAGDCYSNTGTATCQAQDNQYSDETFAFSGTGWLTLRFWALIGGSGGSGYQAYAFATWSTAGPVSYYYHDPSNGYSYYYPDNMAAYSGTVYLNAFSQGSGSFAGVTASW
jgi:hypothetical protein